MAGMNDAEYARRDKLAAVIKQASADTTTQSTPENVQMAILDQLIELNANIRLLTAVARR